MSPTPRTTELKITGTLQPFEKEYFRKDGSLVPVLIGVAMLEKSGTQGIAFVLDLSERKRAEAAARQMQLAHANRVATMGQLTASIAHEINQPIAATVTNAQAALRWLRTQPPDVGEVEQVIGRIVNDGNRAAAVIGRIRELVKKSPPRKEPLDINKAIREMIKLTRGESSKHGASVQTHLADRLPLIQGDLVQLQQVLLNLLINAMEATSSVADGVRELSISTAMNEPDAVLVTVCDTGPGVSASLSRSIRQRLPVWGWDCRSVARSSKHTAVDCARAQTYPVALSLSSPCPSIHLLQRKRASHSALQGIASLAPDLHQWLRVTS